MSVDIAAARRVASARDSLGEEVVWLAYHAAVPVVVDAALVNLLRVNFFLDPPEDLSYEDEARLLLSPLLREIGEGLYEIEPGTRRLLLSGLRSRYGPDRLRQVAALLEQYTDASVAWHSQPELEHAQRLTAMSFLDPARAEEWLASSSGSGENLGREWQVAMGRRLNEHSAITSMDDEITRTMDGLQEKPVADRRAAIEDVSVLARLPEVSVDGVVSELCRFIRHSGPRSPGRPKQVTPDIQAALTLIGSLPHSGFTLASVALSGADLTGLDYHGARFDDVALTELRATGINLSGAVFHGVEFADAVLDGATFDGAVLRFRSLRRVSLAGVSNERTDVSAGTMHGVTATDASGAPVKIPLTTEADLPNAVLVEAAAKGDQWAWEALLDRFSPMLWNITRQYRLSPADASDVVQTTWLRLVEHLSRISDPERLAGWIATTAKRECLRVSRRGDLPRPGEDFATILDDGMAPAEQLQADEQDAMVWAALGRLGEPCQRLIRLLISDPSPSYAEVARLLDMRVGSIGPTRQRCLSQLRKLAGLDDFGVADIQQALGPDNSPGKRVQGPTEAI